MSYPPQPPQPPQQPQQPMYPAQGQPPYGPQPVSPSDARTMSLLAHIGGPVVGFVAPLVIFLIYKDRDGFVRYNSLEALNFQIFLAIAYVVSMITMFVGVGFLLFFAVWICSIVFAIQGAIAANRGQPYRYPVSLRLVS
jgi:uncharacterized Tic20 family protein